MSVAIVAYDCRYRSSVRKLAFDTALRGESAKAFFSDKEILSDILTAYYTDYEPESCLVALADGVFAGYLLGARDARRCTPVFLRRILPGLIWKLIRRGVLLEPGNFRFASALAASFFKGEFRQPDFYPEYPATLHINLDSRFRGNGIGSQLLDGYFSLLRRSGVKGVHLATFSEKAGGFFFRNGFRMLFESRRSYFRRVLGTDISCYIYGRIL